MEILETSAGVPRSPRNHWWQLEQILGHLQEENLVAAWKLLRAIRYSSILPPQVVDDVEDLIRKSWHNLALPLDQPSDYYRNTLGQKTGLPTLRNLHENRQLPSRFPHELVLPDIIGNANDFGYLIDVLARPEFTGACINLKLRIVVHISSDIELQRLNEIVSSSSASYLGSPFLSIAIFLAPNIKPRLLPIEVSWHEAPLWRLDRSIQKGILTHGVDAILFLPLEFLVDNLICEQVRRYISLSDNVCIILEKLDPVDAESKNTNILTTSNLHTTWRKKHTAFRSLNRLAFAISAKGFDEINGFNPRFENEAPASQELAFRLYNNGAYFIPLWVRTSVPDIYDGISSASDDALSVDLLPYSRAKKNDKYFEVPKVSIYIPAYRASKYLSEAISSVLDQDFQDLEICVADDGSPDNTKQILESFRNEPRVRWETASNGGIGHASNRAINMSRGLYIGQLDSDDRLKPGAISRLVSFLDENPKIGCVYSSCERVNAIGRYIKEEYSWPTFSREKMMLTSIAHHFRMFRRQTWKRTEGFREDIVNGVDYDIFLKMSEVAKFHHLEETLYQRRWHGDNTSHVNVLSQTSNTYRVQREALKRLGLDKHWDVHVANSDKPREVTYQRLGKQQRVIFCPDYSRSNPYQRLLYRTAQDHCEIIGGNIDVALDALQQLKPGDPSNITFHLHWLNFVLAGSNKIGEASEKAQVFLSKLQRFCFCGGRLVWTIHNIVSHDLPFPQIENNLARGIIDLADIIHIHDKRSIPEVEARYSIPQGKIRVHRHGSYINTYPDFIDRCRARQELSLDADDEVMLFLGQIRPYKGIDTLLSAFLELAPRRPKLKLVLAGKGELGTLLDGLDPAMRSRIYVFNRFIDVMEIQIFLRAADFSVFPYRNILTSGSLLLSLSFGLPTIVPCYGMTHSILEDNSSGKSNGGILYSPDGGKQALLQAIEEMLDRLDLGEGPIMAAAAYARAEQQTWDNISPMLLGDTI